MSFEIWAWQIVEYTLFRNTELHFNGLERNNCTQAKRLKYIAGLGWPAKTYYYYGTPKEETPLRKQGKHWLE